MEAFRVFEGMVCPLNRVNVDTDQIIPKQFLKRIERQGFGEFLFYHWRFDDDGRKRPNFVLNHEQYQGATVLVAGQNFGCGSSREHAPWSLLDYGFRVIIAQSYADIFYNNCMKNGILPIKLDENEVTLLMDNARKENYRLFINLEEQTITDNKSFQTHFEIDPFRKEMLMNGWDEISLTLKHESQIAHYEEKATSIS